jgi:dual specificity phosphatase 12
MSVSPDKKKCRIIVLGTMRQRLMKVMSLIGGEEDTIEAGISLEYLPCVPVFDSYQNEEGETIRYLVQVDYFGQNATLKKPESLLPFFDDDEGGEFAAISGVAIGGGVDEHPDDIARLSKFLDTMSNVRSIPVKVIKPNPEYTTMKEELAAYRQLSPDEKEKATRLRSLGPGKMADFAVQFARQIVRETLEGPAVEQQPAVQQEQPVEQEPFVQVVAPRPLLDPDKRRYSCRKCRTILFGEDDLQDPPHVPSKHQFSYQRRRDGTTAECQSIFLQGGLDWMGDDLSSVEEGKFNCHRCNAKLGVWHWSGAQCSCGTWVVPAVQIPRTRVDVVEPFQPELPVGTIVSPFAQLSLQS